MKATGADTTKQTASGWDYLSSGAGGVFGKGSAKGGGAFVGWLFCILLSLLSHCRCSMAVVVAPLLFMCGYQNPIRP